ncbi:MAG: sulfite exporter TauE/SafE family protein [Methylocella sp.]
MEFLHAINPLYSLSGFFVGALVGCTGVGGGSIMTPLLVLLFGIHPATAVGTDLLYAGITKSGGTIVHGLNRTVDWRITLLLAAGSLPAAALTLLVLSEFGGDSDRLNAIISTALGYALLLTALTLAVPKQLLHRTAGRRLRELPERQTMALTCGFGALVGVLVTISSVGAGAIGVTVLLLLYPKVPIVRIVGSDIAHAMPLALFAGLGHAFRGSVDWMMLISLLIGSLPGIALGGQIAAFAPDRVLRTLLAGTLFVVGAKLSL